MTDIPEVPAIDNNNLVLICGKSATGKSRSLKQLENPKGVMYMNCENNKKLPFRTEFQQFRITDPKQIYEGITWAEEKPEIHTIVIDTVDFLMNMYETLYIIPATNTQAAWSGYSQFFLRLMSQYIGASNKNFILIGHTKDDLE